jgi:RNA polymerase sigma factor (sigma-70 family)
VLPGQLHSEAVRKIFQDHNRSLLGFLFAKLRSEAEAHEVAQEAYVRLLQLERPGTISFLRAYLFRIAANLAIDRIRHRRVREDKTAPELFEQLLAAPSPERRAMARQELDLVVAALEELPPACRKACALHFFCHEEVVERNSRTRPASGGKCVAVAVVGRGARA